MKTSDFDYHLPPELIAQTPLEPRDRSRLMVLSRLSGEITHRKFHELTEYLKPGDVLVFNDSRVIPARLCGRKEGSGGRVEILLLRRLKEGEWEALVKPGRRVKPGTVVDITGGINGNGSRLLVKVKEAGDNGVRVVELSDEALVPSVGKVPLPPYIHTPLADPERYQTVYARDSGSVAAPTAGLHLTPELLDIIRKKGVETLFVTLHIGLDTFQPVREENPRRHLIHREYGEITPQAAEELNRARAQGRRLLCVGTTSVRLVEQGALEGDGIAPFKGWADLFILPGHSFRAVDGLITNFHLPRSTLLMLVCAFAGRELVLRAYAEAIREGYRFYSFGDGMLIL